MSSINRERYRNCLTEVQNALLHRWDPIGVKDIPGGAGEYESYAPRITDMVLSGKTKCEILEFLWWLETEHMGLSGDREATEEFADHLIEISSRFANDEP
ncbi:MAG: hypothetical protein ACFCU4_04315 [Puniceicoccaceae bacterium]